MTDALRAFEQRLAEAQWELNERFIRIEQLQAELDLSVEALRRARDGGVELKVRSERSSSTARR